MRERGEPRVRLFFALWPSSAMQEQLAAAASPVIGALRSGRPVPRENLHLTLAFLGSVSEASLAMLEHLAHAASRSAAAPALELTFSALEYWPRAQLVCAAVRSAPDEVAAFAEALKQRLTSDGFAPDLKSFRPHVTLARQVRQRPVERTLPQVRWSFREFALIESRSSPGGSLYSVRASWPLYSA